MLRDLSIINLSLDFGLLSFLKFSFIKNAMNIKSMIVAKVYAKMSMNILTAAKVFAVNLPRRSAIN
jgi:cytochrome c oxidase subunit IV